MVPTPQSIADLDGLITAPPDAVVRAVSACQGPFVVLGAGGKMGFHASSMLQRALRLAGRDGQVTTVSRFSSPKVRRRFEQSGFRVVAADISDPRQIEKLPLAENVLFLAGMKFGTSQNPDLLHRMNVRMPQLVADHYRGSRIVALSTGCVYSFTTPQSGGATETSEMNPPGEYARSCIGREMAFIDGSIAHRTRCALIRLNYSIDLTYGVLVDIAKSVLAGESISVDTGYVNVIWQGDAVSHILQTFPHASSPPFIINVTGEDILSVRDIATRFAKMFRCQLTITGQEASSSWLSNPTLSHRMFGKPDVSVDVMMAWIADWLKRGGETLDKPTQFQNRDGSY